MSNGNSLERKYRRGQILKPIGENMFWDYYKVVGYPESGGKASARRKLGYTYYIECYPKNTKRFNTTIIQVNETSISALMEVSY